MPDGTGPLAYDLLVVGAGVAGWTAARRAQDLGLRTLVIEKHGESPGFGNGRISGGFFHAAYKSPRRHAPEELYEALVAKAGEFARENVARAWAATCGRAMDFIEAEGGAFAPFGDDEWMGNVLTPFQPAALGQPWVGAGPDRLLQAMASRYRDSGGELRTGVRGRRLLTNDGRVTGVEATVRDRVEQFEADAVLLCDGGFQADPDLVHRYITPVYKLRGAPNDTGDALRMGLAAGAAAVNLPWFYGHCLLADALHNDRLWPTPSPQHVIEASIMVNGRGERFVDEALGNQRNADAIAKSDTPGECWAVFDSDVWETAGRLAHIPLNPTMLEEGCRHLTAGSIEELAIGILAPALPATVRAYNGFCRDGAPLDPLRSQPAKPVARAPFFAVPLVAGITFTMGGLLVDGHARVLDTENQPIAGLYAAGGSMGGLQGGPQSAYAGGWSEAVTFGLLAAEHVASVGRR